MARDIVTNIVANDKASKPLKEAARAAEDTADAFGDLSLAEQRAAVEAEKAAVRVELAKKALERAEQRHGKEALQTRTALVRLHEAELAVASASERTADKVDDAGDAAERAGRRMDGLKSKLGSVTGVLGTVARHASGLSLLGLGASKLGGTLGPLVPGLARATAGVSAFGAVTLTAAPAVLGLGLHMAALGVKVVQFGGAVAPAAASLLPLAAGLALVKGTLIASGPAFTTALSPLKKAFVDVEGPVGRLATKGLPSLSREFVRVNFPAIRQGMKWIAEDVNQVVVGVGKWINSTTGQKAIAASVENITGAFSELAPDVEKLAIAFLNLFGRTAGDTRAVDLLATALNRAIVGATNFINGLTTAKINAAWAAIGRLSGGVQDFAGRIPGWGHDVMGAVRWWKAHAEEIQHVRDVLGVVAIAVGVATGGWLPALGAAVSLLVAHWDTVSAAMQRVKRWFNGNSEEAARTRAVVGALQGGIADLVSWFRGQLLPALERAGGAVLPTLREAIGRVTKTFDDNREGIGKAKAILTALGIVVTQAIIPAISLLAQVYLKYLSYEFSALIVLINRVVLPGIRIFTRLVLDNFGAIINGAADMLGWVPGIGPKLREAASKFNKFRDQVNGALSGINDQKVSVTATIGYTTSQSKLSASTKVGYRARGGPISGPGGPRDDAIPTMLSNGEYVVNAAATARHRPLLEAINSGQVRGYARGGLVMSTSTSGIPQMMAAERKALAAAAKAMAPSLSVGNVGGSVARWAPLVLQVLAMLGQPSSALGPVLSRMRRESGGNPRAINLTDINAQRGDPSIGLMQTIGATFRAYAGPFRARGIYDPLANIYAGINYATHRYGRGWIARMGMPGGYDRGGLARGAGMMPKFTSAPERVLSPAQTVRFERAMSSAAQPVQELHFHFDRYIGNRDELMDELRRLKSGGKLREIGVPA